MKQDPMVNFQKVISLSVRHLQNRYQMSYRGQFEGKLYLRVRYLKMNEGYIKGVHVVNLKQIISVCKTFTRSNNGIGHQVVLTDDNTNTDDQEIRNI